MTMSDDEFFKRQKEFINALSCCFRPVANEVGAQFSRKIMMLPMSGIEESIRDDIEKQEKESVLPIKVSAAGAHGLGG